MINLANYPLILFVFSFLMLWFSMWIGVSFFKKMRELEDDKRETFNIILGATLTLLGLIIGFSFSMAIGHYDQRKNYEAAEANVIGTEYVRADLLSAQDATKLRTLLRSYLDQRVLFYTIRDAKEVQHINARTAQLQSELWSAVLAPASAQPTPVVALVVAGMNNVLDAQGYTQAAWWNRIPISAWVLMMAIAICCHVLVGYGARSFRAGDLVMLVLPFVVSISVFLIADIDSPHGGVIHVHPKNLTNLVESLQPH